MKSKFVKNISKLVTLSMFATMFVSNSSINALASIYSDISETTVTNENISNSTSISVKCYYKIGTDSTGTTSTKYFTTSFVKGSSFVAPTMPSSGTIIKDIESNDNTFGASGAVNYFGKEGQDDITLAESSDTKVVTKYFIGWGVTISKTTEAITTTSYQIVKPGDLIDQSKIEEGSTINIKALYGEQRKVRLQEGDNYSINYYGQGDVINSPSSSYKDENGKVFAYWEVDKNEANYDATGYKINYATSSFTEVKTTDKITIGSGKLAIKAKTDKAITVKFVSNSNKILKTYEVGLGGSVNVPDDSIAPTINGMTFIGWQKENDNSSPKLSAGDTIEVSDNTTEYIYTAMYATTVKLTFIDPITNKTLSTVKLGQGNKINSDDIPTILSHEGFSISSANKGWSVDLENEEFTQDTKIYAQYEATVTLKSNSGDLASNSNQISYKLDDVEQVSKITTGSIKVLYGTKLSLLKADIDSAVGAFVCSGFNDNKVVLDSNGEYYDITITKNMTLVANVATKVTVKSDLATVPVDISSSIKLVDPNNKEIDVTAKWNTGVPLGQGESIVLPNIDANSINEGYTFVGWSGATKNSKGQYIISSVKCDTTIYPIFTVTATFKSSSGAVISKENIELNNDNNYLGEKVEILKSKIPTLSGKTFISWVDSDINPVTFTLDPVTNSYVSDSLIKTNKTFVTKYTNAVKVVFYDPVVKSILNQSVVPTDTDLTTISGVVPTFKDYSGLQCIGWDNDVTQGIVKNTTVNAIYVAKVKFIDPYGTELQLKDEAGTGVVKSGDNYPQKLNGSTLENITDETSTEQYVQYGKAAIAPYVEPVNGNGDYFKGWDVDINKITKDTTVVAQYAPGVKVNFAYTNDDKVTLSDSDGYVDFYDSTGNVINDKGIDKYGNYVSDASTGSITTGSGGSIVIPKPAVMEGKTFAYYIDDEENKYYVGDTITNITTELNLTAVYAETKTVKFVGLNGNIISTQKVAVGGKAIAPNNSEVQVDGLTFVGYDKDFSNITTDTTITAKYTALVTYLDINGDIYDTEEVSYGNAANGIEAPEREGLTFKSWSEDLSKVTKDIIVSPKYFATVTFKDEEGNIIGAAIQVEEGGTVVAPNYVPVAEYKFEGWDKELTNITKDTTINAIVSRIPGVYVITFKNSDETIIKTLTVVEGNKVLDTDIPNAPTIEGYTFVGWDRDLNNIIGDLDVYPVYEKSPTVTYFTVMFVVDGKVISTQTVEAGKEAIVPQTIEKEGYTFVGWDKPTTNIMEDTVISSVYTKNSEQGSDKQDSQQGSDKQETGDNGSKAMMISLSLAIFALIGAIKRKND